MTRRPFTPTHELRLTHRGHRRGSSAATAPRAILVDLAPDGTALASDGSMEWTYGADGWLWRDSLALPDGYTTLRVRRLQPRGGPTLLRAGAESTNLTKTYRVTAGEWTQIQAAAQRAGKPPSRFVADAAIAESKRTVKR